MRLKARLTALDDRLVPRQPKTPPPWWTRAAIALLPTCLVFVLPVLDGSRGVWVWAASIYTPVLVIAFLMSIAWLWRNRAR